MPGRWVVSCGVRHGKRKLFGGGERASDGEDGVEPLEAAVTQRRNRQKRLWCSFRYCTQSGTTSTRRMSETGSMVMLGSGKDWARGRRERGVLVTHR